MKYNNPNFLIVGAAKCGTTSLARYLDQHPEIFIPQKKELRFFVADAIENISKEDPLRSQIFQQSVLNKEKYFSIFNSRREKMCGEGSVHYLYHYEEVIPKVKKDLGDIPIIIMLRDPIDRAISNWHYNGKDLYPFRKSFEMEKERMTKNYNSFWYYHSLSLYHDQVKKYLINFDHVKVIFFKDFVNETNKVTNETIKFLGLNSKYSINTNVIHNKHERYVPVNSLLKFLHKYEPFYKNILRLKSKGLVPDSWFVNKWQLFDNKRDREFALKFFLEDIEKLEDLLNKDLTSWKFFND